jgi:hypothetical protein
LGGDGGFVNPAMIHAIAILLRAEVRIYPLVDNVLSSTTMCLH